MVHLVEYTKEEMDAIRSKVYKPFELKWGYTKKGLPAPNLRPLNEAEIKELRVDAYKLKFP